MLSPITQNSLWHLQLLSVRNKKEILMKMSQWGWTSSQPDVLLEGARIIRPFLPELLSQYVVTVSPNLAAMPAPVVVDQTLALALAVAQTGQKVDFLIVGTLSAYEPTREWMRRYLEDDLEANLDYIPTPGKPPKVPPAGVCTCPGGDLTWYRRTKGQPVPSCPNHGTLTCT